MAKAEYKILGKCSLCKKLNEGIEVKLWWFIKVFICQSCFSSLFRKFKRER